MRPESPERVAIRLALGQQLAASREAAELGQQQVGRKTGYSRSSVAKAESGRQLLTRDFWTTADELLNAEGALLTVREPAGGVETVVAGRTGGVGLPAVLAARRVAVVRQRPHRLVEPVPVDARRHDYASGVYVG